MSAATTTMATVPSASPTGNSDKSNGQSSPLLFFVALGFGVVFTNLWIIVGVKYCFRYNQRHRQRVLGEDGTPIDLMAMPHARRRRREKKLMTMDEVNDRFPLMKYKAWRASREAHGLSTAGGVSAAPSRAPSVRNLGVDTTTASEAAPRTTLELAQQDHINATATSSSMPASHYDKVPLEKTETVNSSIHQEDVSDDEDDPIRTAALPETVAPPGDTCAICLDNLEDDEDVRGLSCGHAFHAACLDPWLTSRRACCPLCKADYYVPKPRPDENDETSRRERGMRMPHSPAAAWIGGSARRSGNTGRPRFLPGPGFMPYRAQHGFPSVNDRSSGGPNNASQTSGWRSRLPRFTNPLRRGNGPETGSNTNTTPADLEAGTSR